MNVMVFLMAAAGALVLLAFLWATLIPLREERSLQPCEKIELLFPLHPQHFPQLKHSLGPSDARYVTRRGSKELHDGWRAERHRILKDYINELGADFARVMLLRQILNSTSGPSVQTGVFRWLRLALRFRIHYRAVSFCVIVRGTCTLRQLARLSALVACLAALTGADVTSAGYRAVEGEAGTGSIA